MPPLRAPPLLLALLMAAPALGAPALPPRDAPEGGLLFAEETLDVVEAAVEGPLALGSPPSGEPAFLVPLEGIAAPSFAPRIEVEPGRRGSEPGIDIGPDGCVYINAIGDKTLWRSCNGPFQRLSPPSFLISGLDTDVVLDGAGNLYYSDLWLGSASLTASSNQGATWTRNNPLSLLPPVDDRQWLAALAPGQVLLVTNQVPSGLTATRCVLAPATVGFAACAPTAVLAPNALRFCVCPPGQPAVSPDGRSVLVPYMAIRNVPNPAFDPLDPDSEPILTDLVIDAALSRDGGLTWSTVNVAQRAGEPGIFPVAAYDAAGHAHVAWAAQRGSGQAWEVWAAPSVDGGLSWGPALRVSAGGTNVLPWLAAGVEGKLALAWYHTDTQGHPESVRGLWFVQAAVLEGAHTLGPVVQRTLVSSAAVHKDDLCISGVQCDADRDLLDFLSVALDQQGLMRVAFADDHTDGHDGHAHVWYARQTG